MLYGISGKSCPPGLTGAGYFNASKIPLITAAFAQRETLSSLSWEDACTCVVGDPPGYGLMQLTSSFPEPGWQDPMISISYAWSNFITPAFEYWHGLEQYAGDTLVLLVAATYNEGLSAARAYHAQGNVDAGTTDEYGHGVLKNYQTLRDTGAF